MPRIRITEDSPIKVELRGNDGRLIRELNRVGHPGGEGRQVDWGETAATCQAIGTTGLEITFVFDN